MEFRTDAGFLPKGGGLAWVDASAFDWVCRGEDRCHDSKIAEMKRMSNVCSALERRGNYLTTIGVYGEVLHNYAYHEDIGEGIGEARRMGKKYYVTENGTKILASDRMQWLYFDWTRICGRVLSTLSNGTKLYSPEGFCTSDNVRGYVDSVSDIGDVDKGIVVAAASNGHYNGVVSADGPLIDAFEKSVRKFNLKDCFVSNPIVNNTRMIEWGGREVKKISRVR